MSLIPPLVRERADYTVSTSFGLDGRVPFVAPCPCGEGDVEWIATRVEGAHAHPAYDIACTTAA